MRLIDDERIGLACEFGARSPFVLQIVEIFEKEKLGRLLGIIELGGAACLFPKDIVDILKNLLEHADKKPFAMRNRIYAAQASLAADKALNKYFFDICQVAAGANRALLQPLAR
jgi:hypothetical protein